MPRFPETAEVEAEPEAGSRKWIRILVNDRRDVLDRAIAGASGSDIRGPLRWVSPLREDECAEYADATFLERMGVDLTQRPLAEFWPIRGPRWDALGLAANGGPILVEAKAHESEVASDCNAAGAVSQARITKSVREVQRHYAVDPGCDWLHGYYQYANRIAHLYLLREVNAVPATLVFLYVCGDAKTGTPSRASWDRVRKRVHRALGLPETIPGVVDAFVEAKGLVRAPSRGKARN